MKIAALTRLMNDHSTKHMIIVTRDAGERYAGKYSILVYAGNPDNIDKETANLEVNSFTALGKGLIEIYTQKERSLSWTKSNLPANNGNF